MEYNGIINIDKPEGITSHTAVSRVRRLFGVKKAGHSGTLDPLATGVLPIMIGSAVKASDWLIGHDKKYFAGIELGIQTDSEDITGSITSRYDGSLPSFEELESVIKSFEGKIMQTPPMYSAIKKDGHKLVDLARRGIVIDREPREVFIHSITASQSEGKYFLSVACSKGTYIRTLCADIGKALGCGAVMRSLRRTAVGIFTAEDSVPLEKLTQMTAEDAGKLLLPAEVIFKNLERIVLTLFFERLFRNGAPIFAEKAGLENLITGRQYRIYGSEGFFALGEAALFDGKAVIRLKKFL